PDVAARGHDLRAPRRVDRLPRRPRLPARKGEEWVARTGRRLRRDGARGDPHRAGRRAPRRTRRAGPRAGSRVQPRGGRVALSRRRHAGDAFVLRLIATRPSVRPTSVQSHSATCGDSSAGSKYALTRIAVTPTIETSTRPA